MAHQKQKENMPAMKKVYNSIPDFFIPQKQCCFRIRVVMQNMQLSLRKQPDTKPSKYVVLSAKTTETPYLNSYLFASGVAEHRIAKSPGLNGLGALLFFFKSVQVWGLSSIRIMLAASRVYVTFLHLYQIVQICSSVSLVRLPVRVQMCCGYPARSSAGSL